MLTEKETLRRMGIWSDIPYSGDIGRLVYLVKLSTFKEILEQPRDTEVDEMDEILHRLDRQLIAKIYGGYEQ
jgi:hypothetical protein